MDNDDSLDPARLPPNARLRSGSAARLAGLPVTTLRVWERRYGVVAAPKTPTGQRLYSAQDVQRLALLKQLSDRGHAIGTIATMGLEELRSLSAAEPARAASGMAAGPALWVVGRSAAHKLRSTGIEALAVFDDLHDAEAACQQPRHAEPAPEVLLAQLPSLHPGLAERALALRARLQAGTLVVLYAFGAEAVAESLRAAGAVVRREPITGRELTRLLAAARPSAAPSTASGQPGPRRYSDEDLATLAELPSSVICECPRHLAELVLQLAHFERYSVDCDGRNPQDAALHRHLGSLAGAARAMFEQALDRVVAEEGLSLS